MNLFLTEDGVLKLGYYGLTTQAECYSLNIVHCDRFLRFAPEVFKGEYEMKSDVGSLGTTLIQMMGMTPYYRYKNDRFLTMDLDFESPFYKDTIKSSELADFLKKCFLKTKEKSSVNELLNVNVMG